MHKGGGSTDISPSSPSLIAFKPRQVILLEQQQQRSLAGSTPMEKNRLENPAQLKPEDESVLTYSVALWLENKGFSKVLKRFISAAQIQDDNWKARALNLNEIFSKYQEICNGAYEDLKLQKKREEQVVGSAEKNGYTNHTTCEEIELNKKMKKKKNNGDIAVTDTEMAVNEKLNESSVNCKEEQSYKTSDALSHSDQKSNDEKVFKFTVDPSAKKQKDKKKKKSKLMSEPHDLDEKQIDVMPAVTESKHKGSLPKNIDSKDDFKVIIEPKHTKKKKKLKQDSLMDDDKNRDLGNENKVLADKDTSSIKSEDNGVQAEKKIRKKESVQAAEDGVNESKKASKKRKRTAPDENENQPGQEIAVEESKPKKIKGLEEGKDILPQITARGANGHAGGHNKEESFQDGHSTFHFSAKETDESSKGTLDNNGLEKLSQQKSARRQKNSSAEPKPVNAFQRVKVDEVKFADERLQDNSYWAKDGAEIGYGAKAQEVLGQVKGRGFRHEKTKKKRGSYRGGQIDLHSHSIKFNYSDED